MAGRWHDREVPIEFVFLFFYGLERRLLTDDCPEEEAVELVAEIERLQKIYSRNHAFANYSFRLLDFLRAKELASFCIDIDQYAAPPVRRLRDQTYASMLRVGLGQCAADGMEVPASWALAWAESHPGYRERTAAGRCRQGFGDLFRTEYQAQFPYGFRLKGGTEKFDSSTSLQAALSRSPLQCNRYFLR